MQQVMLLLHSDKVLHCPVHASLPSRRVWLLEEAVVRFDLLPSCSNLGSSCFANETAVCPLECMSVLEEHETKCVSKVRRGVQKVRYNSV